MAESTNPGESSIAAAKFAVDGSEPPTEQNCASQSKECSIIEALSDLERVSYRVIPYKTFNRSLYNKDELINVHFSHDGSQIISNHKNEIVFWNLKQY